MKKGGCLSQIIIMKKVYFLVVFILFISRDVYSVIAYPYPVDVKQKDGTTLKIIQRGDENLHWTETTDGYTLLKNDQGIFEYATLNSSNDLVCSGIKATDRPLRTTVENQFLSKISTGLTFSSSQVSIIQQIEKAYKTEQQSAFPTTGSDSLICILIAYTDKAFTNTQNDFKNLFNQVGYTTDGAHGSVKDYYSENSYGQLNLSVRVAGPYTASQNMKYYGEDVGVPGNDIRPNVLASEALTLADGAVNYAHFDNDGDGTVDGVYIIYAGYGQEVTGVTTDAIWAKASYITPVTKDGKIINRYSCSAELRSNTGTGITRIGNICHEFGHVLGAHDFYDTNGPTGGKFTGTGNWDLMGSGSWNPNTGDLNLAGSCPAHHNGYTKWRYYNWLTPTLLSTSQNVSMSRIESNQVACYYNTPTSGELFFLENRQQYGFDTSIPGHGLIIYHVDSSGIASSISTTTTINATHPQYMYPVCANATSNPSSEPSSYGLIDSAGCSFPGSSGITEFSDGSTPCSRDWEGNSTGKPITAVSENTGVISFKFMDASNPGNFEATTASVSQINLSWSLNAGSNPVLIAWSSTGAIGTPANGVTYSAGNSIPGGGTVLYYGTLTGVNHTSLSPSTIYQYKAWSNVSGIYSSGLSASAQTVCGTLSLPYTQIFADGIVPPPCWTSIDNDGDGRNWLKGDLSKDPGSFSAVSASWDNYTGPVTPDNWLITPQLSFTTDSAVLKFWVRAVDPVFVGDKYSVLISTTGNSVGNFSEKYTSALSDTVWNEVVVPFTGYSGQNVYIAFRHWDCTAFFLIFLDNISFEEFGTPANLDIADVTLGNGAIECYDATDTITVAGGGSAVEFLNGSTVDLIAGMSIFLLPGFHAYEGNTTNARITTEALFCDALPFSSVIAQNNEKSIPLSESSDNKKIVKKEEKTVKVYPNPGNGKFTLELTNFEGRSTVSVINTLGTIVYQTSVTNNNPSELELTFLRKGIYFVNVKNGDTVKTNKIILY
jgi:M6 family metalloprotease-like protein